MTRAQVDRTIRVGWQLVVIAACLVSTGFGSATLLGTYATKADLRRLEVQVRDLHWALYLSDPQNVRRPSQAALPPDRLASR